MKIGLISFHSFSKPGGVKNHVLNLYREFKKRGIKTKIIVPRRFKSEDYGKDVILLGTSFPINFCGSQGDLDINFNPMALEGVLEEEKFDILHFHNFGFPSAVQILERSRSLNILTFHSNIRESVFLKTFPTIVYVFNKIAEWKINGIIGVAPFILKNFKDYKGPKTIIPNGVDTEKFNPNAKKLIKFTDPKKINILFLGRIEERKGLIYLLKACQILEKKFPNLRLIVVGDGPEKENCRKWVKLNNLKNVIFEGEAKEENAPFYYRSCDIFCSPAIFGESFGIVLLEALSSAKPVVAFANQGYKEFFKDKKGEKFLVKPKDFKGLAQKLELLIKNKKLREEMGEWGPKEAKNYSWSKIANRVLDFYKLCLKERRKKEKEKGFSIDKILNEVHNNH